VRRLGGVGGPARSRRSGSAAAGRVSGMSELERVLGFVASLAEAAVTDVARDGPITVLRTPDLPLVWDANHLRLEREAGGDAESLAAAATRHGVPLMVVVPDADAGEGLVRGFRELGWRVVRHRYMVHRG